MLERGADFATAWRWQEADLDPVPTEGWTGRARFARNPAAAVDLDVPDAGAGAPSSVAVLPEGRVVLAIDQAEVDAATWRWAEFVVELVSPAGDVVRFVEGLAVITAGVPAAAPEVP